MKSKASDVGGLDPFHIPQHVVSDEDMLAFWGPKKISSGYYYKLSHNKDCVKDIEDFRKMVYGTNKISKIICASFARSYLAHKKGYSVDLGKFPARLEQFRNRRLKNCKKSSKAPFKGIMQPHSSRKTSRKLPSGKKADIPVKNMASGKKANTYVKMMASGNKGNVHVKKRTRSACIGNHMEFFVGQVDAVISELNARIEVQKQLKDNCEERLDKARDCIHSHSSLLKEASETVNQCRNHLEQLMASTKLQENDFVKHVGEICAHWKSGGEEGKLNDLLTIEKDKIDCVKKANEEIKTYQKILEENTLIEQTCCRKRDEKAANLEKIERDIIEIDGVIAKLESELQVQQKYKQQLGKFNRSNYWLRSSDYSLSPLPVYHPVPTRATKNLTVINVCPCPACNLGFDPNTLDIIVASCGHTFHPYCLVAHTDGKVLRKCPKCLRSTTEMWLKSFGVVNQEILPRGIKSKDHMTSSSIK